jgi:two-component system alkaline phosphatase synthesis response regulator PhoP
MKKKIIIVDDEQDIREVIKYNLEQEGFEAICAKNGDQLFKLDIVKYDLILLDIMLPGLDGYEICKRLKSNSETASIPIIFLSAKSNDIDEIVGLELGADDYVTKPISIHKLVARIKNVIKRTQKSLHEKELIHVDELTINKKNYSVKYNDNLVQLTKKEFDILIYLLKNKDTIVTRDSIFQSLWGEDVFVGQRTIDVHVRRIREKLGVKGKLIETIKGIGYRITWN